MPIIGSSKLQITGDITASGAIVAEEFKTDFISGSILFNSGSTRFGDTRDDTHEFTGSISLSGSNVSFLGGSRVGIGTNDPNRTLTLAGSTAAMNIDSSDNAFITIDRGAANDVGQVEFKTGGAAKWYVGMAAGNPTSGPAR